MPLQHIIPEPARDQEHMGHLNSCDSRRLDADVQAPENIGNA
jgi:hypothetical protein